MSKTLKVLVAILFSGGLLATGVGGGETRLLFYWPGCAVLGAAAVLSVLRWRWRLMTTPSDWCLASALLFAGYFVARELGSPVLVWAREDLFMLLGCGVTYILMATVLSHPRWRTGLLVMLLLLLAGNLVVGFINFSGAWNFYIVPHYVRWDGDGKRIGGFFINSNHLGAFLAIMAMLALGMASFGRGGAVKRLLFVFLALAAAIGVALSKSRGAVIGLGAGVLALAVMSLIILRRTHPHQFWKATLGMAFGGGIAALLLAAVMSEQMGQRFRGGVTFEGDPRAFTWESALAQHAEHPWFGAGARMFYAGCVRLRPAGTPPWAGDPEFAHSEWLQAMADYGWIGLAVVVILFATHLLNGWRFLRWFAGDQFPRTAELGSDRLGLVLGSMAGVIAALAHATFEFHFHVPAVAVTVAALMGVLANPGTSGDFWRQHRIPGVRLMTKLALLGCGVVMLWGAGTVGVADYFVEKAQFAGKEDESGRPDLALLGRALKLDPANARTWRQHGLALEQGAGGRPWSDAKPMLMTAESDLQESRRLNPFDPFAPLDLADTLFALGRFADARRQIDDACELAPLHQEPKVSLAVFFNRQRRWAEAEEAYLWAADAKAGRATDDEWRPLYYQMLKDSANDP